MEAFLTLMVAWLIVFLATRKSSSHRGMSQYEKDRIRRANSNKKIILSILLAFVAITADAQFLFRISGNRLKEPSYMLGTIHYLPGSLLDNSIEYMEAEAQCQQMYVEHKITYKRIAAAQQ